MARWTALVTAFAASVACSSVPPNEQAHTDAAAGEPDRRPSEPPERSPDEPADVGSTEEGGAPEDATPDAPTASADAPDDGATDARRGPQLLVFYVPHGLVASAMTPTKDAAGTFALPPLLEGLAAHRARTVIVEGLELSSAELTNVDQHRRWSMALLAGDVEVDARGEATTAVGPTLDWVVGAHRPGARASLLALSVESALVTHEARLRPIAPIQRPALAAEKMGLEPAGLGIAATLDGAKADTRAAFDAVLAAQWKVAAAALDEGRTNVVTLAPCDPNCRYGGREADSQYQTLAHQPWPAAAAELAGMQKTWIGAVGRFLDARAAKGRLDDTLVAIVSEVSGDGTQFHHARGLTAVLVGDARLGAGRVVAATGRPYRDLLATIAARFGAASAFGTPAGKPIAGIFQAR
jgi:hypothetical protein